MRYEEREEMQPVLPEANDQNDREAKDCKHTGYGEVAGEGKGVDANQTQRKQAQNVREQDKHEDREDVRNVLLAGRANIGGNQIVDETGKGFNGGLPA